jgi:hypothetical protein
MYSEVDKGNGHIQVYEKYCSMWRAITRLRHSKQAISVTMIAHAT